MMKKISIWEATAASESGFKSLVGDHSADAVVIGGGITGLTAAMLLAEAGKKVIVLEALKVGLGTTGNSTGNLYVTVDEHLSVIRKKWNDEVMKAVVQSRKAALDLIDNTIRRFEIDCDFTRTSFNYFIEKPDKNAEDFINAEFEALQTVGLSPKITEHPELALNFSKMLSVDGQAQFHPYKYASALAHKISDKCQVYENSQVIDIDEKEGIVRTEHGSVKADHIIMATHTPKGVWMVQGVLGPYREFGVAAELKSGDFPTGIYWRVNQPKHSVRVYSNAGKKYVMVVGDKFKTGQADDTNEYVQHLEKYLTSNFHVGEERFIWGGQQYRPADGLPYIGKHSDKLYFLTGFATDGLVYGTLAAMIVSDQILGKKNLWEETYKLKRFTPVKSFKEFFKENVDNIVQYIKDTPWNADVSSLDEIKPGEGKVLESGGEKLAVYKDENGKTHVLSAACSHMKCIVNFNQVEKTWDCPCHGSRFDIDGQVLEGPAVINLPKKKTT